MSDYVFLASAVLYVLASLRDEGFFGSLLPTAARGGVKRAPPTAAPPAPALAGPADAAPAMPAAFSVANPMRAPGKRPPAEDGPAPLGEAIAPHAPENDKLSASL